MFTFTSGVLVGLVGGVALSVYIPKVWAWLQKKLRKGVDKVK